jgi:hypothetical protein
MTKIELLSAHLLELIKTMDGDAGGITGPPGLAFEVDSREGEIDIAARYAYPGTPVHLIKFDQLQKKVELSDEAENLLLGWQVPAATRQQASELTDSVIAGIDGRGSLSQALNHTFDKLVEYVVKLCGSAVDSNEVFELTGFVDTAITLNAQPTGPELRQGCGRRADLKQHAPQPLVGMAEENRTRGERRLL